MDRPYCNHPIIIAWYIVNKYDSLSKIREHGKDHLKVLEDVDTPGSGGQVYMALDLINWFVLSETPKSEIELFEMGNRMWREKKGLYYTCKEKYVNDVFEASTYIDDLFYKLQNME